MFEKIGNFGKKIIRVGFLGATMAGGAEASHLEIAQMQKTVTATQEDLKIAKASKDKQKIQEAEKAVRLAMADVDIARAKDADEREQNPKMSPPIGVAPKNKAVITGTEREQEEDILDESGRVIGKRKVREISKDMMKHKERIERNSSPNFNGVGSNGEVIETSRGQAGVNINYRTGGNGGNNGWRPFTPPPGERK